MKFLVFLNELRFLILKVMWVENVGGIWEGVDEIFKEKESEKERMRDERRDDEREREVKRVI
jgi:hypothetical protein